MDADPSLFHLHADMGGRGGPSAEAGADSEAAHAELDTEQSVGPTGHQFHDRLERRKSHRSSG